MSFDYYVAFSASQWPTFAQAQTALDSLGYPVRLPTTSDAALGIDSGELNVQFQGRPVQIDAEIRPLSQSEDTDLTYIAEQVSAVYPPHPGDPFLILTFRSDADEIRAGLYLAAALIKGCGGFGFENQHEQRGGANFADQMVSEASNADLWKN